MKNAATRPCGFEEAQRLAEAAIRLAKTGHITFLNSDATMLKKKGFLRLQWDALGLACPAIAKATEQEEEYDRDHRRRRRRDSGFRFQSQLEDRTGRRSQTRAIE